MSDIATAAIPRLGLARLFEQAQGSVAELFDSINHDGNPGGSPIEKLFFSALFLHVRLGFSEFKYVLPIEDDEKLREVMTWRNTRRALLVQQQYQLPGWRVDFLIHAHNSAPLRPEGWRSLIVECDGHDFHERTKDQAARDRSRDRDAQFRGMTVFRFTGSEVVNNPWGCAKQVCEWAERGA